MKKEFFRFLYENESGHDDHFNLPIFYTKDTNLEKHVRACGETFMRLNAIGGTLYEAHSIEGDKRFIFHSNPSLKDFWYKAIFMRLASDGKIERYTLRRCYKTPLPLIINQRLIKDFTDDINKMYGTSHGFQLVSIGLVEESDNSIENKIDDKPEKQKKRVPKWIRIRDDSSIFSWVPGYMYPDGRVETIFGNMEDPDSPDDAREFDDCPFEGYKIVKK